MQAERHRNILVGSNILRIVPDTRAASRLMMNSKPSHDTRVTYLDSSLVSDIVKLRGRLRSKY